MHVYQSEITAEPVDCPYFQGREFTQEVFFADDLAPADIDGYINRGFRRFGVYFFKPVCKHCRECIPLRVRVDDFVPGKSLKRVLKKSADIQVRVLMQEDFRTAEGAMNVNSEYFRIYDTHSKERFGISTSWQNFIESFFYPAANQMIVEYRKADTLFGVGFLDRGQQYLSSIYFAYLPEYEEYSPGHLSVMAEINIAKSLKIPYYCLGYWIRDNRHMNYKTRYEPHEFLNWTDLSWSEG